jgi:hypothetical protein
MTDWQIPAALRNFGSVSQGVYVRKGSKADIRHLIGNVRFSLKTGHRPDIVRRPLSAKRRQSQSKPLKASPQLLIGMDGKISCILPPAFECIGPVVL